MRCRLSGPGMSSKFTWSPVSTPPMRHSGSTSNLRSASPVSLRTSSNSRVTKNMKSLRKKSAGSRDRNVVASRRRAPRQSLRDAAYEAIKHRIITCKFKPGECINEASVSELLGFGRTPVHQALDRLMLEEMVEVIPRKGVIVKPVILHDVLQMIDVRMVNETNCARLAAARADDTHIKALTGVLNRARQAIAGRDVQAMMMLDREFHLQLAVASKNFELTE